MRAFLSSKHWRREIRRVRHRGKTSPTVLARALRRRVRAAYVSTIRAFRGRDYMRHFVWICKGNQRLAHKVIMEAMQSRMKGRGRLLKVRKSF